MAFELFKRRQATESTPEMPQPAAAKPAHVPVFELSERRKFVRPLPQPDVIESDDASAWDLWQQLQLDEHPEPTSSR